MRFPILLPLCCVLSSACSQVAAHPVSHTDAWGKVSGSVEVKLHLFLDDIVRHQIGRPEDHDLISVAELQQAIRRHTAFLLNQLRIFDQHGRPLTASVTALPDWKPQSAEVKLSENNLLKLTWELQFTLSGPDPVSPTSLCFLHSFTHADLTSAGELRLHLQHTLSGKRIDAVIPPGLPHTILLPRESDAGLRSATNANGATSRIVIAPTGIVHEFMAPLLLMDDAWPPAKTLREQSSAPTSMSIPTTVSESDIAATKQQIEAWMRANTQFRIGNTELHAESVTVDLFASGNAPDDRPSEPRDASIGLPLFGTQVGVRMQFPGIAKPDKLELAFQRSPGAFSELTVEVTCRAGQMSQLVPVSTDSTEPAIQFEWSPDDLLPMQDIERSTPRTASLSIACPTTVNDTRPGWRGFVFGVTGLGLFAAISVIRRRSLSAVVRYSFLAVGVCVFAGCLLAIPDSTVTVDQDEVNRLTEQILTDVYHGTMQTSEQEAMMALSRVLHEDLVEEVYLAMLKSLSSSPENGIVIDIAQVDVDSVDVLAPTYSADRLDAKCCWRVHGIVHHWGHSHSRELKLVGDLTLIRVSDRWKLLSISQTESPQAELGMVPVESKTGNPVCQLGVPLRKRELSRGEMGILLFPGTQNSGS
jgi:hypothetical protein